MLKWVYPLLNSSSLIKYDLIVGYFIDVLHNVYKVGMSEMQEWPEEVLESNKTLFLCFSFCMFKICDRGQKAVFTVVEF